VLQRCDFQGTGAELRSWPKDEMDRH